MRSEEDGVYAKDGKRKYLTRKEGVRFLKCATKLEKRRRLFCEVVYFTGCRPSEALSLSRGSVDLSESVIRIRCLKKRGRTVFRRLPIPQKLATELISISPKGDGERIWKFCRTTAWRIIKDVMIDADISGIHATGKGLRHGFGVRSALVKIPLNIIQGWMGHAQPDTTAIYLAVQGDEEREIMKRTWVHP